MPGVVVACVGAVVLIAMLIVRRKMERKTGVQLNGKAIGTVVFGIAGVLILGWYVHDNVLDLDELM